MATATKDFSIEEKLTSLLTLQKIDSQIDEIETLKGELPMEVNDLEDSVEGLHTRIHNIDSEIKGINDYISSRKDGSADAEKLIKRYEDQQEHVKNSREFEAISKEIEMQQLEIQLNNKKIKDAQEELQERQHAKLQSESLLSAKEEVLEHKRKELDKIIKETEKEEKKYEKLSNEARESVDPRLLAAYTRIRTSYRNGLAVVPVLRDSCGGCFNVIPPQRQAEIHMRKKIIVCEHCGRILVDQDLDAEVSDKIKKSPLIEN